MKAVVLVGGEGTRLRPITATTPKPLVPLVDRPFLDHVLDRLERHGITEAVLSSPYLEETFHPFIAARAERGGPDITWITETAPLGTGGAIVHALDALGDEPFFALNGDVLTDLDLSAMRDAHRAKGAAISIALHRVSDARAFGLVDTDADGRVLAFREKPQDPIPGDVNAGTYLIDPRVLTRWTPGAQISIEREIFPEVIAAEEPVVGFSQPDVYWMDLGTPEKYLQAHADLLAGRVQGLTYQAPWVAEDAHVAPSARLDRATAVGAHARVEADARVAGSVLHPGAVIEAGASVQGSILGPGARVEARAVVTDCVLGAGASIAAGQQVRGARIPDSNATG